jgi:hypothetical protein
MLSGQMANFACLLHFPFLSSWALPPVHQVGLGYVPIYTVQAAQLLYVCLHAIWSTSNSWAIVPSTKPYTATSMMI